MSTLSGQTIQSTYQGLLKFADSTSGLTSDFQNIEDGLGNNTGLRIKNGQFDVPNILGYNYKKAIYYGNGIANAGQAAAATQNNIVAFPFTDTGIHSYSAITYSVLSATTTSDTIEFAFYTTQMTEQGIMPYEKIIQFTGNVSTTGYITHIFDYPIQFSATPGYNFMVYKISNSGVTPTTNFKQPVLQLASQQTFSKDYGYIRSFNGNDAQQPFRTVMTSFTGKSLYFSGTSTFDSIYNANTLINSQSSSINGADIGFILHTNF